MCGGEGLGFEFESSQTELILCEGNRQQNTLKPLRCSTFSVFCSI